jgi:predicted enzyme related to lactoylglutathione lyase
MPHVDSHTPGTVNWVDFVSTDLDAATGFYTGLFGWDAETLDAPGINSVTWTLGGRTVGGMLEMTPEWEGIAAHWMTYFAVLDTDDTAKRASDLGGSVGAPPFDTAYGRIAVLADPAGGHFSVITPVPQAAG